MVAATNSTAPVTEARKWQAALARAFDKNLDPFQLSGSHGVWAVPSASTSDVAYVVTTRRCNCPAGANGTPCWHRALVMHLAGLLDDETPEEDDDSTDGDDPTDPAPVATECRRCHGKGEWMETIGWRGRDVVWHRCECQNRPAA